MALVRVDVDPSPGPLPRPLAQFVRAANQRIDEFNRARVKRPLDAFMPSDFERAWRMVDAIARGKLARGRAFCEWGCGFAAVAGLAALAGFDACGIEIEPDLVDEARRLLADFELPVAIARGSFVPQDAGALADCANELGWLAEGGPDGHSVLRLDPDHFDLVFAYPWPGEEEVIFRLFDHFAAPDALLLTFHGGQDESGTEGGLRLDRKVAAKRPVPHRRFGGP